VCGRLLGWIVCHYLFNSAIQYDPKVNDAYGSISSCSKYFFMLERQVFVRDSMNLMDSTVPKLSCRRKAKEMSLSCNTVQCHHEIPLNNQGVEFVNKAIAICKKEIHVLEASRPTLPGVFDIVWVGHNFLISSYLGPFEGVWFHLSHCACNS